MKFSINRETITLAKVDEAKATLAEFKEYYKGGLFEGFVNSVVASNSAFNANGCQIISMDGCEITMSLHEVTAWISCWVKVGYEVVAQVEFDGKQALQYSDGEKIAAYIQIYKRSE